MLRKGLVALMMGVICASSAVAEQPAQKRTSSASTGLMSLLKFKPVQIGKSTTTKKSTAASKAASTSTASKSSASQNSGQTADQTSRKAVVNAVQTSPAPTPAPRKLSAKLSPRPLENPAVATVERAAVNDAERQSVTIRQTAALPDDAAPFDLAIAPAESELQPVPIEQPPVLPNIDTISGPQYFSATQAGMSNPLPVHPSDNWQTYQAPQPVQMVSQGQYWNASNPSAPSGPVYSGYAQMSPQQGGGYPQTGAALYPAPRPGIPHQVGGIAIQNPAFHPHEMLYAHRYTAMYPPYYYKVNGGWMVSPFGVWSHEDWKLQGTTVDVKYKSHISPFSHFKPPVIR